MDSFERKVSILSKGSQGSLSRYIIVAVTTYIIILVAGSILGSALGVIVGAAAAFLFWRSRVLGNKRRVAPALPTAPPSFAQRCPSCGIAQAPGVPFCRSCGTSFGRARAIRKPPSEVSPREVTKPSLQIQKPEEEISCPNCGAINIMDSTFCGKCGGTLEQMRVFCEECGRKILASSAYCEYCGDKQRVA